MKFLFMLKECPKVSKYPNRPNWGISWWYQPYRHPDVMPSIHDAIGVSIWVPFRRTCFRLTLREGLAMTENTIGLPWPSFKNWIWRKLMTHKGNFHGV